MKNKAALIVLVILTAGFFIFMALMFGSGAQVQAITERKLNILIHKKFLIKKGQIFLPFCSLLAFHYDVILLCTL